MPRPKSQTVPLCQIVGDDNRFNHRSCGLSRTHRDTLLRKIVSGVTLDPIWVWYEVDESGNGTAKFILMDGRHRLEAYKAKVKVDIQRGKAPEHKVRVHLFEGSETMAALKALQLNSKDKLSLTHMEKLDAAWSIVKRDTKAEATKPMVASAAGISQRTVLKMRNKRTAIIDAGEDLPETWTLARQWPEEAEWTPPSDEEREETIAIIAQNLQNILKKTRCRDVETIGDAVARALGNPQVTYVIDYMRVCAGNDADYDEFACEEDGNPDF
jgi:hypothetical protein